MATRAGRPRFRRLLGISQRAEQRNGFANERRGSKRLAALRPARATMRRRSLPKRAEVEREPRGTAPRRARPTSCLARRCERGGLLRSLPDRRPRASRLEHTERSARLILVMGHGAHALRAARSDATTATARCCRSGRIHAGAGSSSRGRRRPGGHGPRRRNGNGRRRARAGAPERLLGRRYRPEPGDARQPRRAHRGPADRARRRTRGGTAVRRRRVRGARPSPICSATSTIPAATFAGSPASSGPGGTIAMLEFGLPRGLGGRFGISGSGVGLPVAGRLISPGWHEVGRFLGPASASSGGDTSRGSCRAQRSRRRRRARAGA